MKRLIYLLALIVLASGCAFGPQYIPKQLKSSKEIVPVELYIAANYKSVYIDGKKVKTRIVYVEPGAHFVQYKALLSTQAWKDTRKSMKEKGFTLGADHKTFTKTEGFSRVITARPLGTQYRWTKKSKEMVFEGGKKYYLWDNDSGFREQW